MQTLKSRIKRRRALVDIAKCALFLFPDERKVACRVVRAVVEGGAKVAACEGDRARSE
jgi:hypothetical protein